MTESMDSSHSWVSVGSISSNGDCCVIEMHTHTRVLLRWQARYSAPALTATKLTRLSSGFGFSRSSKAIPLRVLRYADSLAPRPSARAGAPNRRAGQGIEPSGLRERLAALAA